MVSTVDVNIYHIPHFTRAMTGRLYVMNPEGCKLMDDRELS